jgi:four helix bundle protein
MDTASDAFFDHEKLQVYREAIDFVGWLGELRDALTRVGEVRDQLDRAATSIVLNIAEGHGKYAAKDRGRFCDIAHGSALECAAALDVLVAKGKGTTIDIRPGKEKLPRIVRMIMELIKKNSARDYEKSAKPAPDASGESE